MNAPGEPGGVGARHVVAVAGIIVAAVLGLQLGSLLVPALGEVLGVAPLLIGLLVIVTALVLAGTMRPRR